MTCPAQGMNDSIPCPCSLPLHCCYSVAQLCPTLFDPMDCRPICPSPSPEVCPSSCPLHQSCHSAISSSDPSSPSALNLSQCQGLFQRVSYLVQTTKVLEFQLQHQSFCCRKGDPFQGPKLGSCLTLGNELSEETHVLTKQEILLERAPGWRAGG